MGWMPGAWNTYTIGFSGTIFALKVLLNSLDENDAGFGMSHFFRLDLPWRKIVWIELIMAHIMVPGSSFLGHLSGILGGIVFLPVFRYLLGNNAFRIFSQPRFHGSGTASGNPSHFDANHPHPIFAENERQPTANTELTANELRRRRLERFS
jgi:hypothetical protein